MGVVWQARDERLERMVAIKQLVLQPGLSEQETEEARRRAMREARIAARLQHPNAVTVFNVAEHDGQPCLVLEYLPSRSLSSVLADRGALPPAEAAEICAQVASALAAAHAAGIVHRDVKPGNILLAETGMAKITDFGISRAVGDATLTQTGISAGTPAYLAPEVARGQDPSPAADVFSLGATLYHAVEGRPPFGTGQNPLALLHAAATGEVPPAERAGVLSPLLPRLLNAEPDVRPTMREAADMLAETVDGKPTAWTPTVVAPEPTTAAMEHSADLAASDPPARPAPDEAPRTSSASRALLLAGAVVVVLALVTAAVMVIVARSNTSVGNNAVDTRTTSTTQQAPDGRNAPPPATSTSTPSPSTSTPTTPTTTTEQGTATNDPTGGPIDKGQAGTLVINFYNNGPAGGWTSLSPNVQRLFGDEQAFRDYWARFSQVYANNAFNVTDNADGSVTVPVDVTYVTGTAPTTQHKNLRVIRDNGRLLIDSDPRQG